jgi:hypothetical protein
MSILNNIVYYFANPAISFLTLAGLVAIWAMTRKTPSIKIILGCIYLNIFMIFFRSVYCTFTNYWIWKQNPQFKIFLQPDYFIKFSLNSYWIASVITILFGILLFKLIIYLNKKFDNRFFYTEEPYLIFLGIIINPWPMFFFFILFSIACLLILQIINLLIQLVNLRNKKTQLERMPMLYIWIPAMLLSLFLYMIIFTNFMPELKVIISNNIFIKALFEIFFIFR